MWNVLMIIMTSYVMWCGSHVGKMQKLWTSVSLKLLHGQNRNLVHVKYSPWEISVMFFLMMSSIFFLWTILSRDGPHQMQGSTSRHHNEGTYDVIKSTLIPHEEYLRGSKFQFFPRCGFRDTEVQSFSVFPIWLPHHLTYDVIIIIKTFHMRSPSNRENFVSICPAVAEKNTKILCRQTNRQTRGRLGTNEYLRKRTQRIIMAEIQNFVFFFAPC